MVTRQQALDAGMSDGAIVAKIRFGRWQRVHAGVYATFTGPMTRDAQLWAAVLAAGPGAQLSHQTAAEINRLTDRPSPFIHVTIPANRRITSPQRRDHSSFVQPDLRLAICPRHSAAHLCRGDGRRPGARCDRPQRRHRVGNRRIREEQGKRGPAQRRSGRQEEAPLARRPRRDHPAPARAARTPSSSTATTTTSSKRTGSRRPPSRSSTPSPTAAGDTATGTTRSTSSSSNSTASSITRSSTAAATRTGTTTPPRRSDRRCATAGWTSPEKRCESARQVHAALTSGGYTGPLKPCSPTCAAHNCGRPASQCKRPVTSYVSSAVRTASVSVRSGSTASAPAAASSPAV